MGTARRDLSPVHPSKRSKLQKRRGNVFAGIKSPQMLDRGKPPTSSLAFSSSISALSPRTGRRAAAAHLSARPSGGSGKSAAAKHRVSPAAEDDFTGEREGKRNRGASSLLADVHEAEDSLLKAGVGGSRGRHRDEGAVAGAAGYRSSRLFVRGLPPFVTAAELKEKFSSLGGEVTEVCLLFNEKGRSRQCAFVGLKTQTQAAAAKEYFHASFFYTRRISVEFALPKHAVSTEAAATGLISSRRKIEKRSRGAAAGDIAAAPGTAAQGSQKPREGLPNTGAASAKRGGVRRGSSERRLQQQNQEKHSSGSGGCDMCVAGGVVVEEAVVHARKAGVGNVRTRLIFEDFFSSSDDEERGTREAEGGGGAAGCDEEGSSSTSSSTSSSKCSRGKRRQGCAETAAEAVGGGGSGGEYRSGTAAAGCVSQASAAGSQETVDAGYREHARRNDGEGRGSAEEVDDMAWLRQQSVAAEMRAAELDTEAATGLTTGGRAKGETAEREAAGERKRQRVAGKGGGAEAGGTPAEDVNEKEAEKKTEENLALLSVHGRLLLRNFPFATTQEELKALCEQHGEVAEVHVVQDEETRKSKGYAFVSYVFPEHAVAALTKLDGMIFQGRLLQAEAAKPDTKKELRQQQREQEAAQKKGSSTSSFKRKKQQELLQQHTENQAFMEEKVWNLLYVSANAAVDAVAREFNVDKEELLGIEQPGTKRRNDAMSAAARVALAETHLLQATREWIVKEGISAKAFERRGPTLLAATAATTPSRSCSNGTGAAGSTNTSSSKGRGNGERGGETRTAAGQRQQEEEEGASSMERSRDTLIVKHLPTAHVVGAELLRMFEAVGTVVRFLLAPSKTVAIVQYEKERDAAAAFRRLAYRKYKTVPLFIEKAPVDIFVGEEEQRRQVQVEAEAEARAASRADALAEASAVQGPAGKGGRETSRNVRSGAAGGKRFREGREGGEEEEEKRGAVREGDELQEKTEYSAGEGCGEGRTGGLSKKKMKKATAMGQGKGTRENPGNRGDAEDAGGCGVCTPRRSGGGALSGSSGVAGPTDAAEEEEEEHSDSVSANSLFVKNLNFCTTEAALHEVFAGCAGLRSVKLMTKKRPVIKRSPEQEGTGEASSGKKRENARESSSCNNVTVLETLSLGYAFVEFDNPASAAAACKRMQGVVVDAHRLQISISRSTPQRRKNASSSVLPVGGAAAAGGRGNAAAVAAGRGAMKSRKLLVRNLAFQATAADVRGLFAAYGNVTRVCIPTQHEGRSRGFGFVEFATRPEAAAALQALTGTHLYGRKLVLEPAMQETQGVGAS